MPVHFEASEFIARQQRVRSALESRGLSGLLMFRQESMYYLTGFDTFGYCFFQCLYLGVDGALTLLTRAPDLRQAQQTSIIEDIRVWIDEAGTDPAQALCHMLQSHDAKGAKLGIEFEAYGLTAANWRRVEAALREYCELEDASRLVSEHRLVKSEGELEYVTTAAKLADDALEAAVAIAKPGAFEGDILAAMQGAVFRGGGDYPGNEFIIGSGEQALLCRYASGRRHLSPVDQLTLELAGTYRHYHACLMRTILIGEVTDEHRSMHRACRDAIVACMEALKPGRPVGEVFHAHAQVLDHAGYAAHRMNACGYSLGATYTPTWMDWPMFYKDNPVVAAPNMVFFIHIILMNSDSGRAMTLGQTVRVTADGCEGLSRLPLDLLSP